jgi:anhydro-N-acetylmuramic acid kinase
VSKPLTAIGLMSGTSIDGIDVALLETDGETITAHGPSMTVPYEVAQCELLRRALSDAAHLTSRADRSGVLANAEIQSTQWHARAVQTFIEQHSLNLSKIDVIGYHGQTVVHRPELGMTIQLGLGQMLADQLKVPVIFDMRANDMVHGGQGAPLVPAYHCALAKTHGEWPICFVNIGGVANVTWVGPDDTLVAFDTGPGNALIDDWMKQHTGTPRDEGGQMALKGRKDESSVRLFLNDGYFSQPVPKSLDRNRFNHIDLAKLSVADGAATLVDVTARSIAASGAHMPETAKTWVICGGGRHNAAIMRALKAQLPDVKSAEDIGLDGDVIEAEAWAFLAVRSLRGLPLTYPETTGVREPVSGGVIARPSAV